MVADGLASNNGSFTPLVIDILPTNFRELLVLNGEALFVCSLCLNCLLAATLLHERSKELRPYRRVLLQNCAFDFLFTFVGFSVRVETEFCQGELLMINNGIYRHWSVGWHYIGGASLFFTGTMAMYVIPILFYFRYSLIVKNKQLTSAQLTKILVVIVAYGLAQASLLVGSMLSNGGDMLDYCRKLLDHPIWTHPGAPPIDNCVVTSMKSPLFMVYYVMTCVAVTIMYTTMFYCTRAVFAKMRTAPMELRAKVQRQMNTVLVIQLITPILFGGVPRMTAVVAGACRLVVPGMSSVVGFSLAWIPLISPCTTLLFVTTYRRESARLLGAPFRGLYNRLKRRTVLPLENVTATSVDTIHNSTPNHTT